MKKAILIHGYHSKKVINDLNKPTPSNHQWLPWVSKQLYLKGVFPIAIEMPEPWNPNYEAWKKELERFDIDEETVLIGHSYGGGLLVRWLSETSKKVDKVILVAPFMGFYDEDVLVDQTPAETAEFFDFVIDSEMTKKTVSGVVIFSSNNDYDSIQKSISLICEETKDVKVVSFENYGHFTISQMGTDNFPELVEEALI